MSECLVNCVRGWVVCGGSAKWCVEVVIVVGGGGCVCVLLGGVGLVGGWVVVSAWECITLAEKRLQNGPKPECSRVRCCTDVVPSW